MARRSEATGGLRLVHNTPQRRLRNTPAIRPGTPEVWRESGLRAIPEIGVGLADRESGLHPTFCASPIRSPSGPRM
jgi:hypothetical protein